MKYYYILILFAFVNLNLRSQTASDFSVTDIFGNDHSLYNDYLDQGKYVFIEFFNTGCVPCQELTPKIDSVYRDFGCNYGEIFFLGIDPYDFDSGVFDFISEFNMNFPAVSGNDGGGNDVFNTFGYLYTPYKILIAPNYSIISDNPEVNNSDDLKDSLLNMGFSPQLCEGNDFLFFSLKSKSDSAVGEINHEAKTIEVILSDNANLASVSASFLNEANSTVFIDGIEQISGETENDFTQGTLIYEVVSETGVSRFWTVIVNISGSINMIESNLSIYPNPSSGEFYISSPDLENEIEINIIDLTGKLLYSEMIKSRDHLIELTHLDQGIYLIKFLTESGIINRKIIIK